MKRPPISTILWLCHLLCSVIALISCVIILWPQVYLPDAWEERMISYAGSAALYSIIGSLLLLVCSLVALLQRLHYKLALKQLLGCTAIWAVAVGIFTLLAELADVPLRAENISADHTSNKPSPPKDQLMGPNALYIILSDEKLAHASIDTVADTPRLTFLERNHNDLLMLYLENSPRWSLYKDDDKFDTKPGHVVMSPPSNGENISGLVHVAFRHLVEGEPVPTGYTPVKPGSPMPTRKESSEQVPDLAVDLGHNHYLLLAWRGTAHTETAYRALNAAIDTIDELMQPLVEQPEQNSIQRMLAGERRIISDSPKLLLSQPPAQSGVYQAELYVNPGEAGTIFLSIRETATNNALYIYRWDARFSADPTELFRYDLPGSTDTSAAAYCIYGNPPSILPPQAPLFVIKKGEAHHFFEVEFKVQFQPNTPSSKRRDLLTYRYLVQACEDPHTTAVKTRLLPDSDQKTPPISPPDKENTPNTPAPQSTLPAQGDSTAEDATPEQEETTAEDVAPAQGESTAEDVAPAQGESTAEDVTPAQGESTAEDVTPAQGETTTEDATPAQGESTAEDVTPVQGETSAEDATPAQSETSAADAPPAQGETSAEDVAPAPSESTAEDVTPEQSETSAADATPAQGETSAEDVAPAPSESTAENVAPAQSETSAADAPPAQGETSAEDVTPTSENT